MKYAFNHARSVKNHADSVLIGQILYLLEIRERDGLAASQVHSCGNADVRDAAGAVGADHLFKFGQVHVAFEGMGALGVVGLGMMMSTKVPPASFLVKTAW